MSDEPQQRNASEFDIAEARARYRAMMRGRMMRLLFGATLLILLCSWLYAGLAAVAGDVEGLPGHDQTVTKVQCVDCHSRRLDEAPAFNHAFAPTCGFCHRQSPPGSDQGLPSR